LEVDRKDLEVDHMELEVDHRELEVDHREVDHMVEEATFQEHQDLVVPWGLYNLDPECHHSPKP
jgi:hypothetical protein